MLSTQALEQVDDHRLRALALPPARSSATTISIAASIIAPSTTMAIVSGSWGGSSPASIAAVTPASATPIPSSVARLAPPLPAEHGPALAEADPAQLLVGLGRPHVPPGEEEERLERARVEAGSLRRDPFDHPPLAGYRRPP